MTQRTKYSASMMPEPHDPTYENMRREWWHRKGEAFDQGVNPLHYPPFRKIDTDLANYMWRKAEAIITADRQRHPKARRNAPVGSAIPGTSKTGTADTPHIDGFTQPDPRGL